MLRFLFACFILICASTQFAREAGSDEITWLKGIPLGKAIQIGTGKHIMIEVSDPDCRFSRRMAQYWNLRRDVTRYIFLVAMKKPP